MKVADTVRPKRKALRSTSAAKANIRAHYEGANTSRLRSMLPGVVQEARKDLSRATRRELLRTSRALWKNNPLVKAVTERLVTYTIGTGIRPEPDSSDPEWNRRAAVVFEEWAKRADLSSRQSFWKLQEVAFRSMLVDGDVFCNLTHGASGRPRIQLIEAHQIGSPHLQVAGKDDDGVACDANGRPEKYLIQEPDGQGWKTRSLNADAVVHLANIERPGQQRGACIAAATLTTAIDLHDILGLEKAAVKDASSKSDIIKTENGEMPQDDSPIARSKRVVTSDATKTAVEYYREIFGPEARVLKRGDEFTPYEPKRPGPAWQGFVDFLAELVCLSFNLPPSLVRQIKVGGADTRRDLATMQRVCEQWQATLAQQWQRVYEYVIEAEIEDGALVGAPVDWRNCDWQFPRAATVDAGKQSQADREDVRSGSMTLREVCGQYGVPWRKHVRQLATEMRTVLDAEKEFGLPPGALVNRLYGQQGSPIIPDAKSMIETYGAGVRAGSITPNLDDETALRKRIDLPPPSDAVKTAWEKDGGARSPITLASQKETEAEIAKTKNDAAQ